MRTPQLADSLRAAVLQAAIKGELTERSSENARDLLLRIQNEKQALQAKGSLKKTKAPAPVTADEVPFDIPENWVWVRLGEISDVSAGATPDAKDLVSEGEIPYFKVSDMNVPENKKYMIKTESFLASNAKYKTIPANSIIYPKNGGALLTNKRRITTKDCLIDLNTGYCTPIGVDVNYVYLWFFTVNFGDFYTGTAVPTVNAGTIKNLLIPLPPLAEQQAIVEKLTRLLAEIDRLKAEEQSLVSLQKAYPQTLRASVLAAAVRGGLNKRSSENARDLLLQIQNEKQALQAKGSLKKTKAPAPVTADEVLFDIPENWVWVRLGDVTDYGIGKQTPSEKIPAGSLIVEMEDIEKETYRLLDKNRERTPKSSKNSFVAGDVLYGKLRPYLKKVVVADESGFCSTEIIPFNGFGKINPQYLMFCMTSPFMLSSVNQLTYGMDMPRLGTNDAKNLLIPLPPLAEQQAIVEKLSALLAEIDALENA